MRSRHSDQAKHLVQPFRIEQLAGKEAVVEAGDVLDGGHVDDFALGSDFSAVARDAAVPVVDRLSDEGVRQAQLRDEALLNAAPKADACRSLDHSPQEQVADVGVGPALPGREEQAVRRRGVEELLISPGCR
jgi:hypothetical protein